MTNTKNIRLTFNSFVDQIESFFIVPLGRKSIECVIKFNGQIKEKLKCIEKRDLTELFVSLGEGEISIHFNNNSYSIFCGKQSEFNVQETDRYAFDCLFFPLNQKAELQSDKYMSFVQKGNNPLKKRYGNGLYEYALAFSLSNQDKDKKVHIENAMGLLAPFTNPRHFATWASYVLALRVNAFGILKECATPSKFWLANHFFNDVESRFKLQSQVKLGESDPKYGIYIDDFSRLFLDALFAYYENNDLELEELCNKMEEVITDDDQNHRDKLDLLYARSCYKRGDLSKSKSFYEKISYHPLFEAEVTEMLAELQND